MAELDHLEPIIAHRGASAYAPENTLTAFNEAVRHGARAVEFDVMMNQSGDLFIFHDDKLSRTSNGKGLFHEASTDYLKGLDVGHWFSKQYKGEKILLLDEMLDWLNENTVQANFEIKPSNGNEESLTTQFLSRFNQKWARGKALPLVSSFNHEVLRLCEHISPDLPLGLLFEKWDKNWHLIAKEINAFSIHLSEKLVTKKRLKLIKEAGYKVCIYTVNSKEWALRYYAWGADSVFTDYPDLMTA